MLGRKSNETKNGIEIRERDENKIFKSPLQVP